MNTIEYWIHLIAYEVITVLFTLPFFAPLYGLFVLFQHFDMAAGVDTVRILALLLLLPLWFFFAPYVAKKACGHRSRDGEGFVDAYRDAWGETKAELALVPFIGRWFSHRPDHGSNGSR